MGSGHSLRQSLGLDVWPSAGWQLVLLHARGLSGSRGLVLPTSQTAALGGMVWSAFLGPYVVQVGVLVVTAQQAAKGRGYLADLSVPLRAEVLAASCTH